MSTVLIKGALRRYFAATILAMMSTTTLFSQAVLARDGPVNPGPPPPPGRIESCCLGVSAPASTQTSKSSGYVSQVGESSEVTQTNANKFVDALADYFAKQHEQKQKEAAWAKAAREADQREKREIYLRHQVTLDYIANTYLYPRATTKGDPNAMVLLGVYYEFGKENAAKAKEWYSKAAAQSVAAAMGALARNLQTTGEKAETVEYWCEQGAKKGDFACLMGILGREEQMEMSSPTTYDKTKAIPYRLLLDSIGYADNFTRLYYMDGSDTFSIGPLQFPQFWINTKIVENQMSLGEAYYALASQSTATNRKVALENSLKWLKQTISTTMYLLDKGDNEDKEWIGYYKNRQKAAEKLSLKVQKELEKL